MLSYLVKLSAMGISTLVITLFHAVLVTALLESFGQIFIVSMRIFYQYGCYLLPSLKLR